MQARAFSEYLVVLMAYLEHPLPLWVSEFEILGLVVSPLSAMFFLFVTAINTLGAEGAAAFSHAVTGLKLFILVIIVIVSISVFDQT